MSCSELTNNIGSKKTIAIESIESQLKKLSELIDHQSQFNKNHIYDIVYQQQRSSEQSDPLSQLPAQNIQILKSINWDRHKEKDSIEDELIDPVQMEYEEDQDENKTILIIPQYFSAKDQQISNRNVEQSLNSIYNKTLKDSGFKEKEKGRNSPPKLDLYDKKDKKIGALSRISDNSPSLNHLHENEEIQQNPSAQRQGLGKKNRLIDKNQLKKLQDASCSAIECKKINNNTNRKKKTKRQSNIIQKQGKSSMAKSAVNVQQKNPPQAVVQSKGENARKNNFSGDKLLPHQPNLVSTKKQWMTASNDKSTKKLNRVNIGRLHDNIKKTNEKAKHNKSNPYNSTSNSHTSYNRTKQMKIRKIDHNGGNYMKDKEKNMKNEENYTNKFAIVEKLNFDLCQTKSIMQRILEEKNIIKPYTQATKRYLECAKKLTNEELNDLQGEIREPSEFGIFTMKITTIIILFFAQFAQPTKKSLIHLISKSVQHCSYMISEENLILILSQKNKELLDLIHDLPTKLYNKNLVSEESLNILIRMYNNVSEQLDLQLEYFLIKKTLIFQFLHELVQYITYLKDYDLIEKTQRMNLYESRNGVFGYYSSRSKRENKPRSIKKQLNGRKNCDSQRKITTEDCCCETDRLVKGVNTLNAFAVGERKPANKYR